MPGNGIADMESQTETLAEDAKCQTFPIEQCDQSMQVEPRMQESREVQAGRKLREKGADATHHEATSYPDHQGIGRGYRHPKSAGQTTEQQRRQASLKQESTRPH
ncbi:hypothetical protein RB195_015028 [Necator americanus]|uniref:Uncharacterized protein n=1 Tax=Necator americanus TaxID=51031 RepID=A0ABR1E2Z1_NECAM